MPKILSLATPIHGFVDHCALKGEPVSLVSKEFTSSEEGNDFIARLEKTSTYFSEAFQSSGVPLSQVSNFLAVLKPDNEATVYINELRMTARSKIQTAKTLEVAAGVPAYLDDIADIDSAELQDSEGAAIEIPPDSGFALILSFGWRKALYFDYSVLIPGGQHRTDNLPKLFGHFLARLMFQSMYSITDVQLDRMIAWGWFPFISLKDEDRRSLLVWSKDGERKPTSVLEGIAARFVDGLDKRLAAWEENDYFKDQMEFLSKAKDHLDAKDYVSSISVMYPRIEGVLRLLYEDENPGGHPKQGTMVSNLVENKYAHSILLPKRFEEFLKKVYFREFDLSKGEVPLSRHTISHGISKPDDYDFLTASVGFMVFDQLFHYLSD
jgi:hypothetical protein